jgi:basic amino acid/polyamine antiporter, APA family
VPAATLERGIGFWSATGIVVGSIIGQSVFLVAGDIARAVGSPARTLLVWCLGGALALVGSFCYAELGALFPEAGGDYVYLGRGIHPVVGFLFGWTSSMIIRPGIAAVTAAGMVRMITFFVPGLASTLVDVHAHVPALGSPVHVTVTAGQPVAVLLIFIATLLNYLGVVFVGGLQLATSVLKAAALVVIVAGGVLFTGEPAWRAVEPASVATPLRILTALVPVMLAYNGFQLLGNLGGEIRDAGRSLPAAAIAGTASTVILYVAVHWTYFRVLGFGGVAASDHVATDTAVRLAGSRGAALLTIVMLISAFGSMHAGFLTGPRVAFAMARDRGFFQFLKYVDPVFHTPSRAVLFQGFLAAILVLAGTYQQLYSYSMFATWFFLVLTSAALVRLRRTRPDLPRPYRVWGYPWTVIAFGVGALSISAGLCVAHPRTSSIGVGLIAAGVPFFFYWRRRT